jgi:Holliday junction resolvasome RuvABC endonuclease subunit
LSGPESDALPNSAVIGAIYFEEVRRHLGVDAAHVYGGLLATLTAWCERHQIPYQGVPVGTIKRHATGKGNAGKAEVIAAMKALGHPVTDDNEADALALLHWALAQGVDPALSKEVRHD